MTHHFLDLSAIPADQIRAMIAKAIAARSRSSQPLLVNKHLTLFFTRPSARTRLSFDAAMRYLGGTISPVGPADVGYPERETIPDIARIMGLFCDVIVARLVEHAELHDFVKMADVPIINGLSNEHHPCQALADLITIYEEFPSSNDRSLCWVGDINNVCYSLMQITHKLGIPMRISSPQGLLTNQRLKEIIGTDDHHISWVENPREAAAGQKIIYADSWVSIGQVKGTTVEHLKPWQVNDDLMRAAHDQAIFMHCLPAKRGLEVTGSVIDGPQSRVWQQAQNRMYAQISILAWCFDCLDLLDGPELA